MVVFLNSGDRGWVEKYIVIKLMCRPHLLCINLLLRRTEIHRMIGPVHLIYHVKYLILLLVLVKQYDIQWHLFAIKAHFWRSF